jgi:hypothetical protein
MKAIINPRIRGTFLNEEEGIGYDMRTIAPARGKVLRFLETQMFRFDESLETPLTFRQNDGTLIRPCKPGYSFITDGGSIPPGAQRFIRKEGPSYPFHDRAYNTGYWWVKNARTGNKWKAVRISKSVADRMLLTMLLCQADPLGRGKAFTVYIAVRGPGLVAWWMSAGQRVKMLPVPDEEEGTADAEI